MELDECLMEFLCKELDDQNPAPCGNCVNCTGTGFSSNVSKKLVIDAVQFLKSEHLIIRPRKIWPPGLFPTQKRKIDEDHLIEPGRALCMYGDSGWGNSVRNGKYVERCFSNELVHAGADFIRDRWCPKPSPTWVTAIPSLRHPRLVYDYAEKLADDLMIPFRPVLTCKTEHPEQKSMENSTMQARNVQNSLSISATIPSGAVLLVDDIVDSRWTLTIAGWLLRSHGSGPVFPFTLAQASSRQK
jgi:ATP-dependent DNA helicase RecQ